MEKHLNQLIDERNRLLWSELNDKFKIILTQSLEPNYMTQINKGIATIYIYENDINPAYFTHELLHIYLKSKNIQIVRDFYKAVEQSPSINFLFSNELKTHITNCLEHYLMLPLFLKLGFENHHFIIDYNERKMNNKLMTDLQENYKINNTYNKEAIDFFIGKFFAMKTCNNTYFNYSKYYKCFSRLDQKLYRLLCDFWEDWITYNPNDPDDNYIEILEIFLDDLNNWFNQKNII